MMGTVSTALAGFLGAGIGWVSLEFVARPARRFFDLRGEVIRRVAQYANVKAQYSPSPENPGMMLNEVLSREEQEKLRQAQEGLRDLASQMRAFALNETLARWAVSIRYNPARASEVLFGLSNAFDKKGIERAKHKADLETALRFPRHTL